MGVQFTRTKQHQAVPYFPERNWRLLLGNNSVEKRPVNQNEASPAAFPAQLDEPKGLLRYLKFRR